MADGVVRNSRLRFADFVEVDGISFFDTVDLPDVPEQTDDIQYTVRSNERVDLLANGFYGDPALWWVIAVANGIELPPFNLHAGAIIRIPSPTFVTERLFSKAKFG